MVQLKKSEKKQQGVDSGLATLDKRVKSHVSWKGFISMSDAQTMLKGHEPFTYILGGGEDQYHYFIYYVGSDNEIHSKHVQALYVNEVPVYRNYGICTYQEVEEMVAGCMQCSATVCKPLA